MDNTDAIEHRMTRAAATAAVCLDLLGQELHREDEVERDDKLIALVEHLKADVIESRRLLLASEFPDRAKING